MVSAVLEANLSIDQSCEQFASALTAVGYGRAVVVSREGALELAPASVEPIARALESECPDYDHHDAIFLQLGQRTGALMGAFLHRTLRGQGIGGVRLWRYPAVRDFLVDGLRLSRGMGRKNALAGLWWGGGKGVIAAPQSAPLGDEQYRQDLFGDYGRFISSLRGVYVTAEDVGTTPRDMGYIYRATRFMACAPPEVGGSGNPSPATAHGVVCAMEAALDFMSGDSLQGKRIAMQGLGNVGGHMLPLLLERGARVSVVDVNGPALEAARAKWAGSALEVRKVEPGDMSIFEEECDVFAPNALGGVLNPDSIARLKCQLVCGAANNQLLDDERDGAALAARGIGFVPDFVANRMGIVNCANEQYGSLAGDPALERHFGREWPDSVFNVTQRVLREARDRGITPTQAANEVADRLMLEPHPIFGGRTRELIRGLMHAGWSTSKA